MNNNILNKASAEEYAYSMVSRNVEEIGLLQAAEDDYTAGWEAAANPALRDIDAQIIVLTYEIDAHLVAAAEAHKNYEDLNSKALKQVPKLAYNMHALVVNEKMAYASHLLKIKQMLEAREQTLILNKPLTIL